VSGSDKYDPSKGDEFEDFDVTSAATVETEAEMTIESLGGLGDSTDQMQHWWARATSWSSG
jgi:hypothetical protein